MQMYGEGGKTEEFMLRNRTDNFEQGQVDKFKVIKLQCTVNVILFYFYRTMHCSAKRGLAIACRLSVRPSLTLVDQEFRTTQVRNLGN